ncbi:hypothetical protein ATANTOWER_022397 [Ataeniobius toweri]|uniref:Uncharacterized protein n=1 Tax=Ataeniobius toweri TaxID=208326 RepID=A0ABU7CB70_9TELE|nr:hypothetical protein [Ataeniobius toweri]
MTVLRLQRSRTGRTTKIVHDLGTGGNRWGRKNRGRKKRRRDPVTATTATSRRTQHEQKTPPASQTNRNKQESKPLPKIKRTQHEQKNTTGEPIDREQIKVSSKPLPKKVNRLNTSRKCHWRVKQTYQKTWRKKQLAQPLEGRTIRNSDHN